MKLKRQRLLAIGQGAFYLATGIWPLISMASFVAVTGPKESIWLVKTVGLLLMVTGIVLLVAGIRGKVSLEGFLLATGDAAALAAIEIFYVFGNQISAIYLLDAAVEIGLIAAWLSTLTKGADRPEKIGG